jgi:hypothetical protein
MNTTSGSEITMLSTGEQELVLKRMKKSLRKWKRKMLKESKKNLWKSISGFELNSNHD